MDILCDEYNMQIDDVNCSIILKISAQWKRELMDDNGRNQKIDSIKPLQRLYIYTKLGKYMSFLKSILFASYIFKAHLSISKSL